ncbi:conserved Plasmodium protein, unknown function [Babesia microti strain RI]|uniref:RRM domain-containing protein n=1 Tax=Babesia microti (strain RI) TaxID=1133968 RepID=A0A1R4A9T4_BABMR|nr:conserved Plasmodium protein, unknown function [Babesia microti strain RI]SJK85762.1 conserved Plasmodium protein, unknown function [Babesia microti strain RI]|eukprot:XP_021337985.1 conserved Plasmodium protein, unknown function [Babesia microti strain RI]
MDELLEQQGKIIDQICDDMMESPMQGNMELSDGNSDGQEHECENEVTLILDELAAKFTGLANSKNDSAMDDDEEGAIQEDFVPFLRISHDCPPSQSLHILNLPPEMDLEVLNNLLLLHPQLFKKSFTFETNKLHVICRSLAIAKTARDKLDGLVLMNREIQVVYAPRVDSTNMFGLSKLAAPPPPLPPEAQPNYMFGRGGPAYNSSILPLPNFKSNPSLFGMGIPPPPPNGPPSHLFKNKDKYILDNKKTILSLLNNPSPSQWNETQSIIDRHQEFTDLHKKHGFVQRYLLLQDLNASVVTPDLETWIKNSCGYPYPQVHLFDPADLTNGKLLDLNETQQGIPENFTLHLCFNTRKQSLDAHRSLIELHPDLSIQHTAPYLPTNTLWIGNLGDILRLNSDVSQVKELLGSFGTITNFKCLNESNCVFVSYQDIQSAIKARNQLLAVPLSASSHSSNVMNVDFSSSFITVMAKNQQRSLIDQESNGDIEQRLISALKATPEGEKLLEEFLSGSSKHSSIHDLVSTLHNGNRPRYDDQRSGSDRFRRDRYDRQRGRGYSERRSDGDFDRYNAPRVDRFGRMIRDSYPKDSFDTTPRKRTPPSIEIDTTNLKRAKHQSIVCQLLKRGKEICKVSAVFISGDSTIYIPQTLDVNQRAHPERLSTLLDKSARVSLWQLGADTRQDSVQYDKLCDYLITKNRVALLQHDNLQVYIVPPCDKYIDTLKVPDANFMYCYLIPGEPCSLSVDEQN